MNRIDRLHAILTHLQSKKRVTAKEISERFGLSLRTVYRDIKALDESGVPIIGEAGIGYSVMEGYRLPPVMFTQEEASAILLSSKLAEHLTDASVKKYLSSALYKIKAVLRHSDKEFLEELDDSVHVSLTAMRSPENAAHLTSVQKALIEKKVVRIHYCSPYSNEKSDREIEPIGLFYYSTGWHLIAWCRLRKDYRDFRLNRIDRMMLTEESYLHQKHISLKDYIHSFKPRELKEVVLTFDKEVARYIVDKRYLYGFISEEVRDNKVRMLFVTPWLNDIARWLLQFSDCVKIESPEELKCQMKELTTRLQQIYLP